MRNSKLTMRYGTVFFALILCGCQSYNNQEEIARIDDLPFSKHVFAFEVDANDNIIDTFFFEKVKYDAAGSKVYHEKQYLDEDGSIGKSYYDETEDLFYRKYYFSDTGASTFEIFKNRYGEVVSALQIESFMDENPDTIFIKYSNAVTLKNGIEKRVINATSNRLNDMKFANERFFNKNKQLIKEVYISNNDTTSQSISVFVHSKLKEVKTISFSENDTSQVILKYDERELLAEEENFKRKNNQFSKIAQTINTYDENEQLIRSTETDLTTGLKKYLKYVIVELESEIDHEK